MRIRMMIRRFVFGVEFFVLLHWEHKRVSFHFGDICWIGRICNFSRILNRFRIDFQFHFDIWRIEKLHFERIDGKMRGNLSSLCPRSACVFRLLDRKWDNQKVPKALKNANFLSIWRIFRRKKNHNSDNSNLVNFGFISERWSNSWKFVYILSWLSFNLTDFSTKKI